LVSFALSAASLISASSDSSILKINRPVFDLPLGIGGLPHFLGLVVIG
jgi:hypothetical protein